MESAHLSPMWGLPRVLPTSISMDTKKLLWEMRCTGTMELPCAPMVKPMGTRQSLILTPTCKPKSWCLVVLAKSVCKIQTVLYFGLHRYPVQVPPIMAAPQLSQTMMETDFLRLGLRQTTPILYSIQMVRCFGNNRPKINHLEIQDLPYSILKETALPKQFIPMKQACGHLMVQMEA